MGRATELVGTPAYCPPEMLLEAAGFRVEAELVRMLYQLFQGRVLDADRHRRNIQVLKLESTFGQAIEHAHLLWQVTAFAAMEDLTHLKCVKDELDRVPSDSSGWYHVQAYARAEYQRVRRRWSAVYSTDVGMTAATPGLRSRAYPSNG